MILDFLKRPKEDVAILLPGVQIAFNHRLRICFLYELDSAMPEDRYAALEAHLAKRGYLLQVIVAAAGMPVPVMPQNPFGNEG